MVVGATTSGVFLVAYVLAMEMVGPKFRLMTLKLTRLNQDGASFAPGFTLNFRVVAGTLCQYYYTAGYLLMALVAFHICFSSSLNSSGCLPAQLQLAVAADRAHPPLPPLPLLLVGRP